MLEIIQTVNDWLAQKGQVALATVVETWGSAPRRVGSKMALTADMAMIGSVSGGCVETAVIEAGVEALADGKARLLKYGVSDDTAWEVGLTCGGRISVLVEPLDEAWWQIVTDYIRRDQPATTFTILEGALAGRKLVIDGEGAVLHNTLGADYAQRAIQTAMQQHIPKLVDFDGVGVMVDVHRPRPHLIIIGGVHVAQPLQLFARTLGFRVSLVDPRGVFASAERFPNVDSILHSYPDKALPQLGLDVNTYVAVLTHDPKIDDKALIAALPSPAPYIGVLSSRKTHEARVARLRKAGIEDDLIARIYTPVGLDIDAQTPEEIALSIMAQIIAVRNGALRPVVQPVGA